MNADMQVQKDQPSPPTSGGGEGSSGGGGGGGGGGGSYPPHTVLEMPALSPTMSQGERLFSRLFLAYQMQLCELHSMVACYNVLLPCCD